jgi:hypothetical protein
MRLEIRELERRVTTIAQTLGELERRPPLPADPETPAEQRRALGEAEVEAALGHADRALAILLARLQDPAFRALPERIDALLLASEVLERKGDLVGAMSFSREALETGEDPQDLAEAGARWFRLARLTGRLEDRVRLFELWRAKGGAKASGTEEAAQVMYEVAFALRARGETEEARRRLAQVPSESAFGSRAAYLAGALFVEEGDLANAERWFSSVMTWPIPFEAEAQVRVEREVRALAALSTARLRYERGDLDAAAAAYARVPPDSPHRRAACWELAYLESERDRHRAALSRLRCVEAAGAPGALRLDVELLESSLLAHLDRYADSVDAYRAVYEDVVEERDLVEATIRSISAPAELLFAGMERTAVEQGREATPGPATLFGDAWTPDLDRAYTVDRGAKAARTEIRRLGEELEGLATELANLEVFEPLELRRLNLERLLREIDHLAGHAGQMAFELRGRHAASAAGAEHRHDAHLDTIEGLLDRLGAQRAEVTARIRRLRREAGRRRSEAMKALRELERDVEALRAEAAALARAAERPVDAAARAALDGVLAELEEAAMRAEVGVLDTYWLKKQRRTRAVERLLTELEETERQMSEATEAASE